MIMSAGHDVHNLVSQIILKKGVYDASTATNKVGISVRVMVKRPNQRQRVIRDWHLGFESPDFTETLKEVKHDLREFINEMDGD